MKVYDRNGWVNWGYFCSLRRSFIMVVGARGVGKTYGLMKWLIENEKPFIYIRRLQAQLDMSGSESGNPFKKINSDLGIDIRPVKNKKMLEWASELGFKHIFDGLIFKSISLKISIFPFIISLLIIFPFLHNPFNVNLL